MTEITTLNVHLPLASPLDERTRQRFLGVIADDPTCYSVTVNFRPELCILSIDMWLRACTMTTHEQALALIRAAFTFSRLGAVTPVMERLILSSPISVCA